jgi:hypothetical protein
MPPEGWIPLVAHRQALTHRHDFFAKRIGYLPVHRFIAHFELPF